MSTAAFTNTNTGTGAPLLSGSAAGRVDNGGSIAPRVFAAAGSVGNGGTATAAFAAGTAHARAPIAAAFPRDVKQTAPAHATIPAPFPRTTWKEVGS